MIASSVPSVTIDFLSLERTGKPNDYLVCPPGFCGAVSDETSPVFEVPVARLQKEWISLVLRQPRTRRIPDEVAAQVSFEQRSRLLKFPDIITARFYAVGEGHSTLAVYSKAKYGYWDLGVNRRRVQSWLRELEKRVSDLG